MILRHRLRCSLLRDSVDGSSFEKHIKAIAVHFALQVRGMTYPLIYD